MIWRLKPTPGVGGSALIIPRPLCPEDPFHAVSMPFTWRERLTFLKELACSALDTCVQVLSHVREFPSLVGQVGLAERALELWQPLLEEVGHALGDLPTQFFELGTGVRLHHREVWLIVPLRLMRLLPLCCLSQQLAFQHLCNMRVDGRG